MKALLTKETEMEKEFRLKSESNCCRLLIVLSIVWCAYLLIRQYPIQWFEIIILNILFSIRFVLTLYYQKKMIGSNYVANYRFWISLLVMGIVIIFSIIWRVT